MNDYSFEDAVTDYRQASGCSDLDLFTPDADKSERITDGWLLRKSDGDLITIVHYDGSVWCGPSYGRELFRRGQQPHGQR